MNAGECVFPNRKCSSTLEGGAGVTGPISPTPLRMSSPPTIYSLTTWFFTTSISFFCLIVVSSPNLVQMFLHTISATWLWRSIDALLPSTFSLLLGLRSSQEPLCTAWSFGTCWFFRSLLLWLLLSDSVLGLPCRSLSSQRGSSWSLLSGLLLPVVFTQQFASGAHLSNLTIDLGCFILGHGPFLLSEQPQAVGFGCRPLIYFMSYHSSLESHDLGSSLLCESGVTFTIFVDLYNPSHFNHTENHNVDHSTWWYIFEHMQ